MCYSVFLGTDLELTTSEWNKDHRDVYVEKITLDCRESGVTRQFTRKNAYYIGSSLGCGCGFTSKEPPFYSVDETREFQESQADVRKFCALLDDILGRSPECEVFLCWDGDHEQPLQSKEDVTPEYFKYGGWVKDQPTLYVVKKA